MTFKSIKDKRERRPTGPYPACPICGDKEEVYRPAGFQGKPEPHWTPCAAGPPWHKQNQKQDE